MAGSVGGVGRALVGGALEIGVCLAATAAVAGFATILAEASTAFGRCAEPALEATVWAATSAALFTSATTFDERDDFELVRADLAAARAFATGAAALA